MKHYEKFINTKDLLLGGSIELNLKIESLLCELAKHFDSVKDDTSDGLSLLRSNFVVVKHMPFLDEQPQATACSHTLTTGSYVDCVNEYTGSIEQSWQEETKYTYNDLDVGRFKCTQCGLVQYYTGQWKKFFEEGVPCAGSELHFPGGPPKDAPFHQKKQSSIQSSPVTYAVNAENIKTIIARCGFEVEVNEIYSYLKLFLTYRPYLIPGYKSLISLNKFYLEKIDKLCSFEERWSTGISENPAVAAHAIQELNFEGYENLIEKFEAELQINTAIVGQDFSLSCIKVDLFSNTTYLLINVDYLDTPLEQAQLDSQADAVIIETIAKRYFPMIDGVFILNYYIGEPSNILMGPIQTYSLPFGKLRG